MSFGTCTCVSKITFIVLIMTSKGGITDLQIHFATIMHLWKFIDGLMRDSALNHMAMAQQIIGVPNAPHRLLYKEVNQRIQTLVTGCNIENIIPFLGRISFNLAQ